MEKRKIGNKEVMPFTIPSGIITTEVSCLERIANNVPEIGIITTKSIGIEPRLGNREPILAQYMPGGFVNAVGLTNPGAEEFARRLSSITFPQDKFLLISIFGKDSSEFVAVAKTLEQYADGFELNLSCPHASGYGMQLGQDKNTVAEITSSVVKAVNRPVFAKLTPNASNIGEIAKSAVDSGAYGISAINTVGPGYHSVDGFPVLTNKVGGLSGAGIMPIGLKCVRDIRQAVEDILIIAMAGIKNARDINEYKSAGADFFGIGSGALAGLDERELKNFFSELIKDIDNNTNNAEKLLKIIDMNYKKVAVKKIEKPACDFSIISTDYELNANPGQFVFAWIPGIGEKPFSIIDDKPLTLGILERGQFTKSINSLKQGDSFYVRGPYGKELDINPNLDSVLVGGGCGIAGLTLLAKQIYEQKGKPLIILGAKDRNHIPCLDELKRYGNVLVSTEDGSLGKKGLVTEFLCSADLKDKSCFFNCGSIAMIDAVIPYELEISPPDMIYSSVDYMTKCGVGICGSCADKKGKRTCIEGPFMPLK